MLMEVAANLAASIVATIAQDIQPKHKHKLRHDTAKDTLHCVCCSDNLLVKASLHQDLKQLQLDCSQPS